MNLKDTINAAVAKAQIEERANQLREQIDTILRARLTDPFPHLQVTSCFRYNGGIVIVWNKERYTYYVYTREDDFCGIENLSLPVDAIFELDAIRAMIPDAVVAEYESVSEKERFNTEETRARVALYRMIRELGHDKIQQMLEGIK